MWEYKFVFRDDKTAGSIFNMIFEMKNIAGYGCQRVSDIVNTDYYFDSSGLDLESMGIVCRIRQTTGKKDYQLTLKRQVLGPNRETVYSQADLFSIKDSSLEDILQGNFPERMKGILRIVTDGREIEHILTMEVNRTIVNLLHTDSHHRVNRIADINLDAIKIKLPGSDKYKECGYEIELKSSQALFPEADMLNDYLRNTFNLIPVTRSKLRRLIPLIRSKERQAGIPQKVILDMDTGVDDALAIILAMNSPELEVLGITAVSGNISAEQSARNTAAVLSVIRKQISTRYPELFPIAFGKLPETALPDASDVHGPDGLGGVCNEYLDKSIKTRPDSLELFKEIVQKNSAGTITLVTTGPLTNAAYWIDKAPETVKRLRGIVSMGGVFFQSGNRSQAAEFNIHANPSAARKVVEFCRKPVSTSHYAWQEMLPLTFVGLDVTHQVRFRKDVLEDALRSSHENSTLRFIKEFTNYYMDFYYRNEGLDGCYLHDPLAIGYVIDPSLCQVEQYHVEVEDKGEFTSGMTVADYRPTRIFKDKMKEVTWVCYKVDSEKFEQLFKERVLGT